MRRASSRQSKTFIARRRADRTLRGTFVGGLVVVIALVIWGLSSWSAIQITAVQVSGADDEYVERVHDLAMNELAGSYIGLFPRANSYMYPRSAIRRVVSDLYQAVESVDVARSDRHTLVVTVHEKAPAALICVSLPDFDGNDISLQDSDSCYFADQSGFMFKKAPSFSGAVYDRYYMPDLGGDGEASSTVIIGSYATSTNEFTIIRNMYHAIEDQGIAVDALLTKPSREYELYVRNPGTSSSTVIVYLNTAISVDEQVSNLVSFWNHEVSTARTKGMPLLFDSIDVRYPPNVYHRFAR